MLPLTDSEAHALLAAIAGRPDDPTPRLAQADWVKEGDGPRGGWVRDHEVWPRMALDGYDQMPGRSEALYGKE